MKNKLEDNSIKITQKNHEINVAKGGWANETFYLVYVSYSQFNLIHKAIFFSGILDIHYEPGLYNCLFNPTYDHNPTISEVHYMKVIRKLDIGL